MKNFTYIIPLIIFFSISFECFASSISNEKDSSNVLAIVVGIVVLGGIALSFISHVNHKGGGYASRRDYSEHQRKKSDNHMFLILLVVGFIFLISKSCM